jgi:hypothetical protein
LAETFIGVAVPEFVTCPPPVSPYWLCQPTTVVVQAAIVEIVAESTSSKRVHVSGKRSARIRSIYDGGGIPAEVQSILQYTLVVNSTFEIYRSNKCPGDRIVVHKLNALRRGYRR